MYRDPNGISELVRSFSVYTHGPKRANAISPAELDSAVAETLKQGYRVKLVSTCPSNDCVVFVTYIFELLPHA